MVARLEVERKVYSPNLDSGMCAREIGIISPSLKGSMTQISETEGMQHNLDTRKWVNTFCSG